MTQRIRANVRVLANSARIRRETLEGRAVLIVPSVTLPDDIVMNGLRYPAAEIAKACHTLERTPAPLGHPVLGGQLVSASDPEAMNIFSIGAFNRNVRRIGGRVHLEKVIDIAVAKASVGGRRVLHAIEQGLPIHTSTSLIGTLHEVSPDTAGTIAMSGTAADTIAAQADERQEAVQEVRDIVFDHDAILLDEPGAATPEDGVGMLVNHLLTLDDVPPKAPLKAAPKAPLKPLPQSPKSPQLKGDTTMTQDDITALIEAALAPLEATIAALAEDVAALKAKTVQADEAERSELAEEAVAQGLLTNHTAREASTKILKALLANGKKAYAASPFASGLRPLAHGRAAADLDGYNLNDALKETPAHA